MDLTILIGLQASGKSTFYRARLAATHVHVSKDLMGHNRHKARRQQELIAAALAAGQSVVVDNTTPTVEERAPLIALGHAYGAPVIGYYFESGVGASLERNKGRACPTSPSSPRSSACNGRRTPRASTACMTYASWATARSRSSTGQVKSDSKRARAPYNPAHGH